MNEVLDIDGNAWCIVEYDACLGDSSTRVGFGKTIAEAEADYGKELRRSVTGNLPKETEALVYDGFSGIACREPNISFIGYGHRESTLRVGYANGKHYNYVNVPVETWFKLLVADSKGRHIAENIKGKYRYYCVNGD